jgi:hypothetical protein
MTCNSSLEGKNNHNVTTVIRSVLSVKENSVPGNVKMNQELRKYFSASAYSQSLPC